MRPRSEIDADLAVHRGTSAALWPQRLADDLQDALAENDALHAEVDRLHAERDVAEHLQLLMRESSAESEIEAATRSLTACDGREGGRVS